jgi:hypothetical protein
MDGGAGDKNAMNNEHKCESDFILHAANMYRDSKTTVEWKYDEGENAQRLKNNNNNKVNGMGWEEEEEMSRSTIHSLVGI